MLQDQVADTTVAIGLAAPCRVFQDDVCVQNNAAGNDVTATTAPTTPTTTPARQLDALSAWQFVLI